MAASPSPEPARGAIAAQRSAHETTKQQYAAALASREQLIDNLKADFAAARKALAQARRRCRRCRPIAAQ